MSVYILHHDDADGYASAAAAYLKFGENATYSAVQYGQDFPIPLDRLTSETEIYIVDFSYSREVLDVVHERVGKLVVIDHHKTAQEALDGLPYAVFDMNYSGATLAWRYFHPEKPVPYASQLVEDRDLWRFKLPLTNAFNAGVYTTNEVKNVAYWAQLLQDDDLTASIAVKGKVLEEQKEQQVAAFARDPSKFKIVQLGEHTVAVYNTTTLISDFGSAINQKYDIDYTVSYFVTGNGECVLSFRSKKGGTDVSEIAKQLGGGGHANAAGAKLPLEEGLNWLRSVYLSERKTPSFRAGM